MADPRRVASRFLNARDSVWGDYIKHSLSTFNKLHTEIKSMKDPLSDKDRENLAQYGGRMSSFTEYYGLWWRWMSRAFSPGDVKDPHAFAPSMATYQKVIDGEMSLAELLRDLDAYQDAIQNVLDATAPVYFQYQGFKVENIEHLGEKQCFKLLEGVDFLVALFKRRGVSPLLKDGLHEIRLVFEIEDGDGVTMKGVHGGYRARTKTILLPVIMLGGRKGRFPLDWVNEVFLHEFAHYVQYSVLSTEASNLWDSAWSNVKSKTDKSERDQALTDLEIVSDYGKTNEREDFAETFVAFMAAPEKLTPTAKFRMQQALSLSGFYNKPVMRLSAARVARRF